MTAVLLVILSPAATRSQMTERGAIAENPPRHSSMCIPEIVGTRPRGAPDAYLPADAYFRAGRRAEAFQAYYQMLFCPEGRTFVGTTATGGPARSALDDAIWNAYNARYDAASALAAKAASTTPGEADYLLAQIQWARGRKAEAEDAWERLQSKNGTDIDDDRPASLAASGARDMLDFDRTGLPAEHDAEALIDPGPRTYRGPYARALCAPGLRGDARSREDGYPVADDAFRKGDYPTAFRAYYQRFYCEDDPLYAGLDRRAVPSGGAGALDFGLFEASRGNALQAIPLLAQALRRDRRFAEGEFVMGQLQGAAGLRGEAEATWLDVLGNPGYPQTIAAGNASGPDAPLPARAAARMLDFARSAPPAPR